MGRSFARGLYFPGISVRLDPGELSSFLAFQSATQNDASRVYVMPRGDGVTSVTAAMKIFMDDYQNQVRLGGLDYRDFGLYADKSVKGINGAGSFLINTKSAGNYFAHMPQIGFSRSDGGEINLRVATVFTGATEAQQIDYSANYVGPWVTGAVVPAGACVSYGVNSYKTTAGGTNGATPPTHTAGTVGDGGVSWAFLWDNSTGGTGNEIRQWVLIGNKDDRPLWKGATRVRDAILHLLRDFVLYPAKRMMMIRSSGAIVGLLGVRDGSTNDVWLSDSADTFGMRWNFDAAGPFVQTVGMARSAGGKTVTATTALADASGCEKLVLAPASAANYTGFVGQPTNAVLIVAGGTANATLVHNATPGADAAHPTIATATSANRTLTAQSALMFHLNSSGTQWIEQGRP